MGRSREVATLRVVQPETSRIAVLNEGQKIQSTRIKDYTLETSAAASRSRSRRCGRAEGDRAALVVIGAAPTSSVRS